MDVSDTNAPQNAGAVVVAKMALALGVSLACWAAAAALWDRWWAPWGSSMSSAVFAAGALSWLWLLAGDAERTKIEHACAAPYLAASSACLLVYAAFYSQLPQLVSCELALAALGCVLLGALSQGARSRASGVIFLLLLSAHVATSLEFFIGYPLRLTVGKLAAFMLGQHITAVGTGLTDESHTVFIDAPCSGVRMLSTSLILASALAVLKQLGLFRTALLLAAAVILAVLGNAERAASLFILGRDDGPEVESALGIILFVACVGALAYVAVRLKPGKNSADEREPWPRRERSPHPALYALFVFACMAAMVRPVFVIHAAGAATDGKTVWPTTWNGERLIPIAITDGMRQYLNDFPGDSQQFAVGTTGKLVLLRRTALATRKLHSSENCYRGKGVTCAPMPAVKDSAGRLWSQFRLERPFAATRTVRQCYIAIDPASSGGALEDWVRGTPSWPDASSWYWAAARPASPVKATLAITVLE